MFRHLDLLALAVIIFGRYGGISASTSNSASETNVESSLELDRSLRSINTDQKYTRWPKRSHIPYSIDSTYSPVEVALIKQSISQIMNDVNYWITFIPVPNDSPEFKIKITPLKVDGITPESVCYTFPGMLTIAPRLASMGIKEQRLVLARGRDGCMDGTIHSILKYLALVLGERNEHQRGDRDQYLQINYQSLGPLGKSAYKLYSRNESNWLMFPYDYCSITHNQPTDFALPGSTAFSVLKAPFFIPKLDRLSEYDCRLLLVLYNGDPSACNPLNCSLLINPNKPAAVMVTKTSTITTTSTSTETSSTLPSTTTTTTTTTTPTTETSSSITSTTLSTMPATVPSSTTTSENPTFKLENQDSIKQALKDILAMLMQRSTPSPLQPTTTATTTTDTTTRVAAKSESQSMVKQALADMFFAMLFPTSTASSLTVSTLADDDDNPVSVNVLSSVNPKIKSKFECPKTFCSARIDQAALHMDGTHTLLFSGNCVQLIDSSFAWSGQPQLLKDVFADPNIRPPIRAAWTDLNTHGQFRMHLIDSDGIQRGCTLNRCDLENLSITPSSSAFAIQMGDSQVFRLFTLDDSRGWISDSSAPNSPLSLRDFQGGKPSPAFELIRAAWMFYGPSGSSVVAMIGEDEMGNQFVAGLYVDLTVKPAKFTVEKRLSWGIVGSGRICNDFAVALKTLPTNQHQIVAVASREERRAKNFAARLGIDKFYGSYEALAQDPEIDVVYVGTINTQHVDLCKRMLQHGKHVLCETPLTLSLDETRALFDFARKKRKFLMEGIWSRCFPAYRQLRKELANHQLGPIRLLTANFGFNNPNVPTLAQRNMGGGVLLNVGCYVIQLATLVFQNRMPTTVQACATLNADGVDLTTAITLQYDDGAIAHFLLSMCTDLESTANIVGTDGQIQIGAPFLAPTQLSTPTNQYHYVLPFVDDRFPLNFINSAGLAYEAEEVRRCILAGELESPCMTHADSILNAQITDGICRQINLHYD